MHSYKQVFIWSTLIQAQKYIYPEVPSWFGADSGTLPIPSKHWSQREDNWQIFIIYVWLRQAVILDSYKQSTSRTDSRKNLPDPTRYDIPPNFIPVYNVHVAGTTAKEGGYDKWWSKNRASEAWGTQGHNRLGIGVRRIYIWVLSRIITFLNRLRFIRFWMNDLNMCFLLALAQKLVKVSVWVAVQLFITLHESYLSVLFLFTE